MPWFAVNRIPAFETVHEKYVLSDGVRTMDLYPVWGLGHSGNMLIAGTGKMKRDPAAR